MLFRLDVIEFVITTDNQRYHIRFLTLNQQGLYALVGTGIQKAAQFLYRVLARCVDNSHVRSRDRSSGCRGDGGGMLDVGRIVAAGREGNGIFTGVSQYMKFV